MKPQEKALLLAIVNKQAGDVRKVAHSLGNYKQNCYYFRKWTDLGWYDYGVAEDLGWLTLAGKQQAEVLEKDGTQG